MARPRTTRKWLPKYVTVVHGSYWYRPPKQKAVRIGPVDDEAGMYRFIAKTKEPGGPMVTLNDLFDRFDRDVIPTLQPRTQRDYRKHLVVLRKVFGHMPPNDVQPRDVGQFLDVDKGKIQRNRMVAVLSAVYGKAVGRWYVADRNPCAKVERNPQRRRDRSISDEEFAAVRALSPPRLQVAMDLALLTGQRQGDLIALTWRQVSPEGIEFRQGKTGKRLLVTMSPTLQAVLDRARGFLPHLPREYVLRRRDGKPYTGDGFRALWQRSINAYVKAGGERFTFHDIRAKSATDSSSIQDAYERLGHTSMSMTRSVYDRGLRKVTPLK